MGIIIFYIKIHISCFITYLLIEKIEKTTRALAIILSQKSVIISNR